MTEKHFVAEVEMTEIVMVNTLLFKEFPKVLGPMFRKKKDFFTVI